MSVAERVRGGRAARAPAYTLTEMLVVLVIIGLLAAIVGPRLFSRLDDAKVRTARLQMTSLETAVDLFRIDVGRAPSNEEGLNALISAPADASSWLGPYLSRGALPQDPWGRPYRYELSGETYRIISYGADGREGGAGRDSDLVVSAGALQSVSPVMSASPSIADAATAPN